MRRPGLPIAFGLAAAILAVYAQTLGFEFIAFDDDIYVSDNPHVRGGLTAAGVAWAFSTFDYVYWQPLTWLSHMLDVELFGLHSGLHHLTNVLLHVANTLLLFGLLRRMTGFPWRAAFVAGLFALHPLRVESVAWVAERKDVLCALFWLLAIRAWQCYTEAPSPRRYGIVAGLFVLGLMAKPMIVTLPFALLLLDYWPLRRIKGLPSPTSPVVREKLPLLALSGVISIVAYYGQKASGAMAVAGSIPLASRIQNAVVSYAEYLRAFVWPHPLAMLYPVDPAIPAAKLIVSLAVVAAVSALALWQARRRPWILVGWLWFVGTLVPVIGLVQVGAQARADRFTYIPLTGLFIAIVWTVAELSKNWAWRQQAAVGAAAVLFPTLGAASWAQTRLWRDSTTLFEHTLRVTGNNGVIHHNLGFVLAGQGRRQEAIMHLERAVRLAPQFSRAHYNLGRALAEEGRTAEALAAFREAARLRPEYAEAHFSLGMMLLRQQDTSGAETAFEQAIRHKLPPEYAAQARNYLGVFEGQRGRLDAAAGHFRAAIRSKPDYVPAHKNYALTLARQSRKAEAIAHLTSALRVTGGHAELRGLLAALQAD